MRPRGWLQRTVPTLIQFTMEQGAQERYNYITWIMYLHHLCEISQLIGFGFYQMMLQGIKNGLEPTVDMEFAEDVLDVVAGGGGADG